MSWTTWGMLAVVALAIAGVGAAALSPLEPWRDAILQVAKRHVELETPYQWGGGHGGKSWGLDCSGLVIECARAAGIDLRGWDAQRMWKGLPHTSRPNPGDLACYAPRHVVVVESFDPSTGIAAIIGANGGDSSSTSPERAHAQNAYVKREPSHLYRSGFLGFATLAPLAPRAVPLTEATA